MEDERQTTVGMFDRTERLLGAETMARLAAARVILFGVGGVGGWCAESLVRSGVRHLTLVDCDTVNVSNLNRQVQATTETVGRLKVDVLRGRLLSINPDAEIVTRAEVYYADTADSFHLEDYDFVIDAIDSLSPSSTRPKSVSMSSGKSATVRSPAACARSSSTGSSSRKRNSNAYIPLRSLRTGPPTSKKIPPPTNSTK